MPLDLPTDWADPPTGRQARQPEGRPAYRRQVSLGHLHRCLLFQSRSYPRGAVGYVLGDHTACADLAPGADFDAWKDQGIGTDNRAFSHYNIPTQSGLGSQMNKIPQ